MLVHFFLFVTFCFFGFFFLCKFLMQNYTLNSELSQAERDMPTESKFLVMIYWLFTVVNVCAILALFILAFGYISISGKQNENGKDSNPFGDDQSEDNDFPHLKQSRISINKMQKVQNMKIFAFSELLVVQSKYQSSSIRLENECSLCLGEFQRKEQICRLDCKTFHAFHTSCFEKWLLSGHQKCPICQT